MSKILTPNDLAEKIIDDYDDSFIYETATNLLAHLQGRGYCIWQTYTKEDVESNIGRKPTNEEMQMLADSLQCFENIRNV